MISKFIGIIAVAVVSVGIAGAAHAAQSKSLQEELGVEQVRLPNVSAQAPEVGLSNAAGQAAIAEAQLFVPSPAEAGTELTNAAAAVQVAKGDDDDDDDDSDE